MSEKLRACVADLSAQWQTTLEKGFEGMQERGLIRKAAVPGELAEATLAAIQGGYLLSSAKRDRRPMQQSLDLALRHLRSFSPGAGQRG